MPIKALLKKLFEHEEEINLEKADNIVKELLESMGTNHKDAQMDIEDKNMLGWAISVNDIIIYIYIFQSDEKTLFIKFVSPIMYIPNENILPFYRKLLEVNNILHDIGFSIENNLVLMFAERRIDLTSIEESKYIILYLARIAKDIALPISEEFNAKIFKEE